MPAKPADVTLTANDIQNVLALDDDTAIAAALRLIEIQLRGGGLRDDARTARRLHLSPGKWRDVRAILLELFEVRHGVLTHPALAEQQTVRIEQRQARSQRAKAGWAGRKMADTRSANASHGSARGHRQGPGTTEGAGGKTPMRHGIAPPGPAPETRDSRSSTGKVVVDRGVRLFTNGCYSERQARELIGVLRKNYDDDALLAAITETDRHKPAEPFAYVRKIAENLTTKKGAKASPGKKEEKPRLIATPETMGLSGKLVQRIQENARRVIRDTFSLRKNATITRRLCVVTPHKPRVLDLQHHPLPITLANRGMSRLRTKRPLELLEAHRLIAMTRRKPRPVCDLLPGYHYTRNLTATQRAYTRRDAPPPTSTIGASRGRFRFRIHARETVGAC